MEQQDLQAAFNKAKAALEELGRIIERQLPPKSAPRSTLPRRKLCELILKEKPGIGIYEILDELRKRGCPFTARNAVNSVRTTLYRSPEFICENGLFRLRHS